MQVSFDSKEEAIAFAAKNGRNMLHAPTVVRCSLLRFLFSHSHFIVLTGIKCSREFPNFVIFVPVVFKTQIIA